MRNIWMIKRLRKMNWQHQNHAYFLLTYLLYKNTTDQKSFGIAKTSKAFQNNTVVFVVLTWGFHWFPMLIVSILELAMENALWCPFFRWANFFNAYRFWIFRLIGHKKIATLLARLHGLISWRKIRNKYFLVKGAQLMRRKSFICLLLWWPFHVTHCWEIETTSHVQVSIFNIDELYINFGHS